MFNRVVKWMLKIVNRRICSVEELNLILDDMRQSAKFDADGYITIGELVRYLIRSFRFIRGGALDR